MFMVIQLIRGRATQNLEVGSIAPESMVAIPQDLAILKHQFTSVNLLTWDIPLTLLPVVKCFSFSKAHLQY